MNNSNSIAITGLLMGTSLAIPSQWISLSLDTITTSGIADWQGTFQNAIYTRTLTTTGTTNDVDEMPADGGVNITASASKTNGNPVEDGGVTWWRGGSLQASTNFSGGVPHGSLTYVFSNVQPNETLEIRILEG
jgi:hypothetical protein